MSRELSGAGRRIRFEVPSALRAACSYTADRVCRRPVEPHASSKKNRSLVESLSPSRMCPRVTSRSERGFSAAMSRVLRTATRFHRLKPGEVGACPERVAVSGFFSRATIHRLRNRSKPKIRTYGVLKVKLLQCVGSCI